MIVGSRRHLPHRQRHRGGEGALGDIKRVVSGRNGPRATTATCSRYVLLVKLLKTRACWRSTARRQSRTRARSSINSRRSRGHFALDFIADTLRMMTMSMDDPFQVEECMQAQLRSTTASCTRGRPRSRRRGRDAGAGHRRGGAGRGQRPWRRSTRPVEVLGGMIGGALVGTFLGVFLAYGFIGPIAEPHEPDLRAGRPVYAIIARLPRGVPPGRTRAGGGRARARQRATVLAADLQRVDEVLSSAPGRPLAA
jgi:chemotaxis protein MotA